MAGEVDWQGVLKARLAAINDLGTAQTTFQQLQAQKRAMSQQAAAQRSTIGNAYGTMQNMQSIGANGAAGGPGKGADEFQRFKHAIAMQESGNNFFPVYHAGNPYNAIGKYAILGAHVPQWSKQALGYSVSAAQFKGSPELQEKVATYHLQRLYNKFGAAGAAVAWYAGEGTAAKWVKAGGGGAYNAGQAGGYPSINKYVKQLLARM